MNIGYVIDTGILLKYNIPRGKTMSKDKVFNDTNKMYLKYCEKCIQMTNHDSNSNCLKCWERTKDILMG